MRICDICKKDMPPEKENPNKVIMYEQGRNNPMDLCVECQNKIWIYARKTLKEQTNESSKRVS